MRAPSAAPFLLALICMALPRARAAENLPVQLQGLPDEGATIYVGQQVRCGLKLFLTDRPDTPTRFSIPDAEGGIFLKLPDSPVFGNDTLDGKEYQTRTYEFAYYPHRSGTGKIPAIGVRVKVGGQEFAGSTEPATIEALLPPGAEGLSTLVTTTEFEVTESWQPEPGTDAKVGDAFTRTITLKAPNVLGMGFPPLPKAKPDGVGAYPKNPTTDDKSNRGTISGSRSETIVYVCEKEGAVTLPGMIIPWFDLDSKKLKQVELPSIPLTVAPDLSQQAAEQEAAGSGNPASIPWPSILLGAIVLAGTGFAWVKLSPRLESCMAKRRARIEASEPHLFKLLRSAAQRSDATATLNAAPRWLASLPVPASPLTLVGFAEAHGDAPFQTAVARLQESLFSRTPSESRWDSTAFLQGLETARKNAIRHHRELTTDLAPLNPNSGRS